MKEIAQGQILDKWEESKARVSLLHDRKRSVEDLEQTIRLLQKLRFEPNGILSSIRKMLEQGSAQESSRNK